MAESAQTLNLIRRFIFESLIVFDQKNLESMGVADYFPPDIQWYGPGGIGVNGLDFWRREGDMFTENWVFVDMLHLFRQFGVDLLTHTTG